MALFIFLDNCNVCDFCNLFIMVFIMALFSLEGGELVNGELFSSMWCRTALVS